MDGAGLVTAVGNGTATVTAASGEAAGSAAVAVDQAAAEVRVSPDSVTFAAIGDTARLAAMAVDANGHAVADAEVKWSSDDTLVAVVDSAGLVTAVGDGDVSVAAASGEAAGGATVTVDQAVAEVRVSPDSVTFAAIGDTARLAAMAVDANGHAVADVEVAWSSGDTLVAVVDSAGLVTAVGGGDVSVAAASGEAAGSAAVAVDQAAAEVRVSPDLVTFAAIGDTARLAAMAVDANGHVVADAEVKWSSGDTLVAVVDSAGLVTAVGNGDASVTAASEGAAGAAAVTVVQTAAKVQVSPNSVAFGAIGDTARFIAKVLDANGHVVADAEVAWSSGDTLVAVVDSAGLVTAVGNGDASVTAASEGVAGAAAVTVVQTAAKVQVSPNSVALGAVGDTARFIAKVLDANGHVLNGAVLEWSSANQAVAVVMDRTGLLRAVGNGETTVTARNGGVGGNATVLVGERAILSRERAVLEMFYNATGGADWVRSDNWLTGAPLDTWYGIAVQPMGRVLGIRLRQNGLTGVLPDELGELGELKAIDLGNDNWSFGSGCFRPNPPRLSARAMRSPSGGLQATGGQSPAGGSVRVWTRYEDGRLIHANGSEDLPPLRVGLGAPNQVSGHIPPALGGLANLELLDLSGNLLSGPLPKELGQLSKLEVLFLTANLLSESIPMTFGDLSALRQLRLGGNSLSGGLPATLGRLRALEILGVAANALSGPLPPELGNLRRLQELSAFGNGFVGSLPSTIGNLVELRDLLLTCSHLTGPIPWEIGGLRRLERLWMFGNQSSGDIPASIGHLSQLREMNLGYNFLTGPLPLEIGNLASLEKLDLAGNNLKGSLPPELGNLMRLRTLDLSRNYLAGALPPELGKLASLQSLDLLGNDLTGLLPSTLGNLTSLRSLEIGQNNLTGTLPSELANLANLKALALGANSITGTIPVKLGNMTNLEFLSLGANNLTGSIPRTLAKLKNLRSLELANNNLSGSLPRELGNLTSLEGLSLGENSITGPIPPELGDLTSLKTLLLGRNGLSGPIPPELGNLTRLESLSLFANNLAGSIPPALGSLTRLRTLFIWQNPLLNGPLPRALMRIPLERFYWRGTNLCSPRGREFQDWLAGIPNRWGEGSCRLVPRETLAAFYDATGGGSWTANTNWMTDAPVSLWHGITVEDSLVVALRLPDNGLEGALPPEIGGFADLKRLDLSGNRLSGALPDDLAVLDSLGALDLSDNQFEGTLPGSLTGLGALRELDWANSGACAPEAGWFQGWLSGLDRRSGPDCRGPFALEFAADAVTQATSGIEGPIPLIGGRAAAVPVFAAADRVNDLRPKVRITVHSRTGSTRVEESILGSHRGIPVTFDVAGLDTSTPVVIPGSQLSPGAELVVELDPESAIPRSPRVPLRFPRQGRLELDVREMPPMNLTIVPVLVESGTDSSVLGWVRDADDAPVEFMRAVLPVGDLAVAVREPLKRSAEPVGRAGWHSLLQDIDLLRTTEGGTGYWYGAVGQVAWGIIGLAYIDGRRASAGIADAEVFAHEIGHNMGLLHAPCGGPAQVDPDYPYSDGSIGVWGWDPRTGEFREPATPELMSYCGGGFRNGPPQWISDYHFGKAMEHRLSAEGSSSATAAATADDRRASRLLLRGGVSPEGELRLDPAFVLDAPALTPGGGGPYRIRGHARDGRELFALNFDMTRDSQGGGGFLFLLPFEAGRLAGLSRIELAGPEGSVALDGRTPVDPVAMVVDRTTGRIRSILRGEAARRAAGEAAADAAGQGTGQTTVTLVSTGVPDVSR